MKHLALKVEKKWAQETLQRLIRENVLESSLRINGDAEYVYVPVTRRVQGELVTRDFEQRERKAKTLKELLVGKLSPEEIENLTKSYDTVGDIAILEIRPQLEKKAKIIAEALIESNPRLKTVARKGSAMLGEFRVRKLHWLAGRKSFTTVYRENGVSMKVALDKVYFSPRLSNERARIATLVKKKEKVLVLFAGVGPFALVISKKQSSAIIKAVELNPVAVKLMKENILLNKVKNVEAIAGDVRKVMKKYPKWANRIAMPLPHTGKDFLSSILPAAAKGCVVHFYAMAPVEDLYSESVGAIKKECSNLGFKCRILRKEIVRPYAPKIFQVVIDFSVS